MVAAATTAALPVASEPAFLRSVHLLWQHRLHPNAGHRTGCSGKTSSAFFLIVSLEVVLIFILFSSYRSRLGDTLSHLWTLVERNLRTAPSAVPDMAAAALYVLGAGHSVPTLALLLAVSLLLRFIISTRRIGTLLKVSDHLSFFF